MAAAGSPIAGAEEFAIHDYEGFGKARTKQYTAFARVSDWACFIVEHGAVGAPLLDHFSGDIEEARVAMADRHLGAHASFADYVQELTGKSIVMPHPLRCYVDWQAMARDAEMSGDLFTVTAAWDLAHLFAGC